MPKLELALEKGGPKRLHVSWAGLYKNVSVAVDGRVVAAFADKAALTEGRTVTLEDGSRLGVKLEKCGLAQLLHVTRDGRPVMGTPGAPDQRLQQAGGMIYAIAVFNVVLGLLAGLFKIGILKSIGLGFGAMAAGGIYALLAYFVMRRSVFALTLAVLFVIADGIALLVFTKWAPGRPPPVGGLVARVFFLIPMFGGFRALRELEEEDARARASSPPPRRSAPATSGGAMKVPALSVTPTPVPVSPVGGAPVVDLGGAALPQARSTPVAPKAEPVRAPAPAPAPVARPRRGGFDVEAFAAWLGTQGVTGRMLAAYHDGAERFALVATSGVVTKVHVEQVLYHARVGQASDRDLANMKKIAEAIFSYQDQKG